MQRKRSTPVVLGLLLAFAAGTVFCSKDPSGILLSETATTIVSDNPDPSVGGQVVSVGWNVSAVSSSGTPTGNVLVSDGNAHTCQAPVGAGFCNVIIPTAGNVTLTAAYLGDGTFSASSDTEPHSVIVVGSTASITNITTATPDPSRPGQSVTVSWTVQAQPPATGTPTGTVSVSGGGGVTCSASVAAGSCSLAFPTAGAKTLTATYAGDAVFASSQDTEPHTVDKGATTVRIISDVPEPSMPGQNVLVQWVVDPVAPAAGTPTGTVTVTVGAASCSASVATGSCSVAPATSGAATLTANYAGDGNFLASSDTEPHTVLTPLFQAGNPAPGASTISMQPGTVSGSRVTVRITATTVTDFFGAAFRVTYDPAFLTFDSSDTAGSFLRDGGVTTQFSVNGTSVAGSVLVGATRVDAGANDGVNVVGTRDLLTLTFRVRAVPPAAGTPLTFGDPKEVRDSVQPPPEGNLIVVTWTGGTVKGQ